MQIRAHLIFSQVPCSQELCANTLSVLPHPTHSHTLSRTVNCLAVSSLKSLKEKCSTALNKVFFFHHNVYWSRWNGHTGLGDQRGMWQTPLGLRKDLRPGSDGCRAGGASEVHKPAVCPGLEWMTAQVWTSVLLEIQSGLARADEKLNKKHLCLLTNNTRDSLFGSKMEAYTSHSY